MGGTAAPALGVRDRRRGTEHTRGLRRAGPAARRPAPDRRRRRGPLTAAAPELAAAVMAGDAESAGRALRNDLEAAAVSLRPALGDVMRHGMAAGALRAMVSGSGPTVAFLARDAAGSRRGRREPAERRADGDDRVRARAGRPGDEHRRLPAPRRCRPRKDQNQKARSSVNTSVASGAPAKTADPGPTDADATAAAAQDPMRRRTARRRHGRTVLHPGPHLPRAVAVDRRARRAGARPRQVLARPQGRRAGAGRGGLHRRAARHRRQQRHRRAGAAAARGRSAARRRGAGPGVHLRRHRHRGLADRRPAGVHRHRPGHVRDGPGVAGVRGHRGQRGRDARPSVLSDGRHDGDRRGGRTARTDGAGGQRRGHRHVAGRPARRTARQRRCAVVLPHQDAGRGRRRRDDPHRRPRRGRAGGDPAAPRPDGQDHRPHHGHLEPVGCVRDQQQDGRPPGGRPDGQARPAASTRHRPPPRTGGRVHRAALRYRGHHPAAHGRRPSGGPRAGVLRLPDRGGPPGRAGRGPHPARHRHRDVLPDPAARPALLRRTRL